MLLNKIDRLPPEEARIETLRRRLLADAEHHGDAKAVGISALTGAGVDEMLRLIDDALPFDPVIRARFRLAAGDGASMHLLHEFGRVVDTRYENDHCIVEADVSESLRQRLSAHEV
jgi:50S ribosomal subunit-associated GTPase HflX